MDKRSFLKSIGLAGLTAAAPVVGHASKPGDGAVWFEVSRTSESQSIKMLTLSNPPRLVFDFSGYSEKELQTIKPLLTLSPLPIKALRLAENSPGVTRLVLESIKPLYGTFIVEKDSIQIGSSIKPLQAPLYASNSALKASLPEHLPEQRSERPDLESPKPSEPEPVTKAEQQQPRRRLVIVLDPGHGGRDPGAIGASGLFEKNFTLEACQRIKKILDKHPKVDVYLTRTSDKYVGLRQRVEFARDKHADLFLSVHADAFKNRTVRGASTYRLSEGRASSVAAKWLADKENSADFLNGIPRPAQSDLQKTLLDLAITAKHADSARFGNQLLEDLGVVMKLHKRRVEAASFAVLTAPDTPSVLLEAGFISNRYDEQNLKNPRFLAQLCDAIAQSCLEQLRLS